MNYKEFQKTDDHALNIALAIEHCKRKGIRTLTFDKDTYVLRPQNASSRYLSISNHNVNEVTSVGFALEGMQDFTIDGGGSTFVCDGVMVTAAILHSQNVTFQNAAFEVREHMRLEAKVIANDAESFTVEVINGTDYVIRDRKLFMKDSFGHEDEYHFYIEICGEEQTGEYLPTTRETFRHVALYEDLGNRRFRVTEPVFVPNVGTKMIFAPRPRHGTCFFAENSCGITVKNVQLYTGYGMAMLGQLSRDITVEGMTVKAKDGALHSINNDALHFVCCAGTIHVSNSHFEGMLDDALNVHGFYTPIERVDEDGLLVSFRQPGSIFPIPYKKGSRVALLDRARLVRTKYFTVADAVKINERLAYLTLEEGTREIENELWRGELLLEAVDYAPDLIFEHNVVQNNRARGILPNTAGKVRIQNNYFHTTGPSVLFIQSIGLWYESSGTNDVILENNVFDNCGYCTRVWGKSVIETKQRNAFDGENYFHQSITLRNNVFQNNVRQILFAANVKRMEFLDNKITNTVTENEFVQCGEVVLSE